MHVPKIGSGLGKKYLVNLHRWQKIEEYRQMEHHSTGENENNAETIRANKLLPFQR